MMLAADPNARLPRRQEVHCLWAAQQQTEGAFEAAAAGFLAGDQPSAAVAATARRGGADALQVPLDFRETLGVAQTNSDLVANLVPYTLS